MSSRPLLCPKCKTAIAEERPAKAGSRLRAIVGLAYGESVLKPGYVRVICPVCGHTISIKGRLMIEPA